MPACAAGPLSTTSAGGPPASTSAAAGRPGPPPSTGDESPSGSPPSTAALGEPPGAVRALTVPPDAQAATVVRHVDGDTLVVRGQGAGPLPAAPTRVRLLQVDTPETGARQECFGPEAADLLAALLPVGAPVRVAADLDLLDRYGRSLLLLWDEAGRSVQEVLVAEGAATVLAVGRNARALAELEAVQERARHDRRGLWGAC